MCDTSCSKYSLHSMGAIRFVTRQTRAAVSLISDRPSRILRFEFSKTTSQHVLAQKRELQATVSWKWRAIFWPSAKLISFDNFRSSRRKCEKLKIISLDSLTFLDKRWTLSTVQSCWDFKKLLPEESSVWLRYRERMFQNINSRETYRKIITQEE